MKNLFLHCGHGRTGSTSLQMAMAENISKLQKNNIIYPYSNALANQTVVSGNFELFHKFDFASISDGQSVFFSRETLWQNFLDDGFINKLACLEESGFTIFALAIERDLFEFGDSVINHQFLKSQSIDHRKSARRKAHFLTVVTKKFEKFKSIVLGKGYAKRIYSYEEWRTDPKSIFFDAFGFELPSIPTNVNKSSGEVKTATMYWVDARLPKVSESRSKWQKEVNLRPLKIRDGLIDAIYHNELSYVDTVIKLGAKEPEDLKDFIQNRVDKHVKIEQDLLEVDILLVRLVEINIQKNTVNVALGIIKSILWEQEGSLLLFKMLAEQECFCILDEILEHPTLDKTSLAAHIYLGNANLHKTKHNYTNAAFHFEAVMQREPTEAFAMILFTCYYKLGDIAKLQITFDRWINLIKSPTTQLFWEGRLAELKGEHMRVAKINLRLELQTHLPHSIKKWINAQKH